MGVGYDWSESLTDPSCDHAVRGVDLALPPTIWYPARGLATVWDTDTTAPPAALADLLCRTRAGILDHLAQPTSTTELAQRWGVTPGTESQRLGVVHRAGLVIRARNGHLVLDLRSLLGDQLLT
ncbi:ArsR/SmtB family transcription factor [Streptomyces sp. NPDC058000]|uniref:ArsR/SmtB family transcription factor n=1 Tax=Streptomyces sp. NPDC058000 TaxID=3346299 RepID=UPI0036EF91F9